MTSDHYAGWPEADIKADQELRAAHALLAQPIHANPYPTPDQSADIMLDGINRAWCSGLGIGTRKS